MKPDIKLELLGFQHNAEALSLHACTAPAVTHALRMQFWIEMSWHVCSPSAA